MADSKMQIDDPIGPFTSSSQILEPSPTHHRNIHIGTKPTHFKYPKNTADSTPDEKLLLEPIHACFKMWDLNKDGTIDRIEVGNVLKKAGLEVNDTVIESFISLLHNPNSGNKDKIQWDDFKNAYLRKYHKQNLNRPIDQVDEMEENLRRKHSHPSSV